MERVRKIEVGSWCKVVTLGLVSGCMMVCFEEAPSAKPPIKLFDADSSRKASSKEVVEQTDAEQEDAGPVIRYGKQSTAPTSHASSTQSEESIRPVVYQVGASTLVEVEIGGHEALMLLDTGASYTTLTPWFAKKIGVSPPSNAPSTTFRTANGTMVAPFGTIASFKLGKEHVGPVTFSLCESCGEENVGADGSKKKIVGLLGMNVLGRYRMQMEGGVLELVKGRAHANRRVDISPWLEVENVKQKSRSRTPEDEIVWELEIEIVNRSKHTIKDAKLAVLCEARGGVVMIDVNMERIESRKSVSTTVEIDQEPLDCASRGVEVVKATW